MMPGKFTACLKAPGGFFRSPLPLLLMSLLVTLFLSCGAASLTGNTFVATDLFEWVLKQIMQLDGIPDPRPRDFMEQLGAYGVTLCIMLLSALLFFCYLVGWLALYVLRWCIRFVRHRLLVKRDELPTQSLNENHLFVRKSDL